MFLRKSIALPFILLGISLSAIARTIIADDEKYVAWIQEIAHTFIHPFHEHKL